MSASGSDKQLQRYLAGDDAVSRIYREAKQAEPPVAVDEVVLRAARESVSARAAKVLPLPRSWLAPLAAAATMLLVVGLAHWFGGPTEQYRTVMEPQPAADAPQSARVEQQVQGAPAMAPAPPAADQARPRAARKQTPAPRPALNGPSSAPGGNAGMKQRKASPPAAMNLDESVGAAAAPDSAGAQLPAVSPASGEGEADSALSAHIGRARDWAGRLHIPYRELPEPIWRERMAMPLIEWQALVRAAAARGERGRALSELEALLAVHGAGHPDTAALIEALTPESGARSGE